MPLSELEGLHPCCRYRELPHYALCVCGEDWGRHLFEHPHGRPNARSVQGPPRCLRFEPAPPKE